MEANTSVAAHAVAQASGGATNATTSGKLALGARLGLLHAGPGKAVAAGAWASGAATGSGAGSIGAHAAGSVPTQLGIRTMIGMHLGMKPPVAVLALKTSLLAKALAVVSLSVVGVVVAAHTGALPTAQAGLSAVPSWSGGSSLVAHLQAGLGLQGSGSGGLKVGL
jgi:hypothetical protein